LPLCKCKLREYLERTGAIVIDNIDIADVDFNIENLNKDSIIRLLM